MFFSQEIFEAVFFRRGERLQKINADIRHAFPAQRQAGGRGGEKDKQNKDGIPEGGLPDTSKKNGGYL